MLMLTIFSCQKNANKNHNEKLLHTHLDGYNQNIDNKTLVEMWRNWNAHIILVGLQISIAAVKKFGSSLEC